ncbi:hypothetical protein ALO40_200185 [Pseudomonas syringae pv. viburni]|uniref:Uncharacterized protein n=1 Tax=Pseudomonas syringae pv. viburni TaxID=251703 RepID=A0A0Q0EKB1_9PSED|nr:hypothetical protein ALO40_200185 [Pseudomonas syringae pv. viburni]
MRQKRRALTRSQFRFMTVDCRSNQMNAGSFANNPGLLARIDAINLGVVSRNPRKFRHPNSSPASSASRSIILSLWKV